MKKQLFFLVVLVFLPLLVWSAGTLDVSLGYGIPGDHHMTVNDSIDVDLGTAGNMCFSAEYIMDLPWYDGLFGGVGVSYQGAIDMDEEGGDPACAFIPVYLQGGYKYPLSENTCVRGLINLGFDFLNGNEDYFEEDPSGGFYAGIGAGFEFNERFFLDAIFNYYTGSHEVKIDDYEDDYTINYDISQSVIVIRLGIKIPEHWEW